MLSAEKLSFKIESAMTRLGGIDAENAKHGKQTKVETEEGANQLTYDERFYPARRAALSYAALVMLFALAIPGVDEKTGKPSTLTVVKLTFVDISFEVRVLTFLLLIALLFYTVGFWRAHSITGLLNSDAIARAGKDVSAAIARTAEEIATSGQNLALSNRLYDELVKKLNHPNYQNLIMDNIIPGLTDRIRHITNEASMISTIKSGRNIDVTEREAKLQYERVLLLHDIMQQGDLNLQKIIRDRQSIAEESRNDFNIMADKANKSLAKLEAINANFVRLSRDFNGAQARWYLLFDVGLVYLAIGISLVLGTLALFGVRYSSFTFAGVVIPVLLVVLAAIPLWLKWWPHLKAPVQRSDYSA